MRPVAGASGDPGVLISEAVARAKMDCCWLFGPGELRSDGTVYREYSQTEKPGSMWDIYTIWLRYTRDIKRFISDTHMGKVRKALEAAYDVLSDESVKDVQLTMNIFLHTDAGTFPKRYQTHRFINFAYNAGTFLSQMRNRRQHSRVK